MKIAQAKIKVLIITARADYGGGPEHIFRLISSLNNQATFYIAAPNDEPYHHKFETLLSAGHMIKIPRRKFRLSSLFKLIKFARNNIDLIHSHGKGAGIYSRLISLSTGIPCVHTFHGFHTGSYNLLQKKLYTFIEKFLAHYTKKFITVSQGEQNSILRCNVANKSKFALIHNAVQIPEQTVNEAAFNKERLDVVTITRFDFAKNSLLLLEIAEELRLREALHKFRFIIIGSGPDEREFIRLSEIKKLESYFVMKGFVENPSDILVDSFCYISTSKWEGMPLGVMEAMSHGLPVLASNVVGNNDLVEDNVNGFLYELNDIVSAVKKLLRLSDDFDLWKNFSVNARKSIIQNFSLALMAEKTYNLYSEIYNSKQN